MPCTSNENDSDEADSADGLLHVLHTDRSRTFRKVHCSVPGSDLSLLITTCQLPSCNPTHSFWIDSSPDANPLAGEGSQDPLPSEADVCIIRAGITGVGVAYHLIELLNNTSLSLEHPLRIVILEATFPYMKARWLLSIAWQHTFRPFIPPQTQPLQCSLSSPLDWARNLTRRRQRGEGIGFQGPSLAVVEVPYAQGTCVWGG
ncbi:hypothetical protein C8R48DRAFT_771816 [Suillus tomentosus]|nr:hypothetical protein C8R48DRAFT_771816 [Suillus tomentosus]